MSRFSILVILMLIGCDNEFTSMAALGSGGGLRDSSGAIPDVHNEQKAIDDASIPGDTKKESGTPIEASIEASEARAPLTCPNDSTHCNGKAWNGTVCPGYAGCNEALCWCFL